MKEINYNLDANDYLILTIIRDYNVKEGISSPILDRFFYNKLLENGCPADKLYDVQLLTKLKTLEHFKLLQKQGLINKITEKGIQLLEQYIAREFE